MTDSSMKECCVKGFAWSGKPSGTVGKLANNQAYIVGTNKHAVILLIHDAFGWEFPNIRLLADHLAQEANATVYVPDFFGGENLPWDKLIAGDFAALSDILPAFMSRNSREVREPEIFAAAKALKSDLGFAKVGASGYCYGGWACLRLAASPAPLVDAISIGHPSLVTKDDLDGVDKTVAVQVLAPEFDTMYTAELKTHTFSRFQELGVPFSYQHFPGVVHGCFIRGKEDEAGEREAMVQGKNAAVAWFREWLHQDGHQH